MSKHVAYIYTIISIHHVFAYAYIGDGRYMYIMYMDDDTVEDEMPITLISIEHTRKNTLILML